MRLRFPDENWIDDVFDRRNRRLYAYCVADVKVTKVFYADYADIELRIVLAAILGYTVATPRYRLGEPHNLSIGGIMISLQWGRDREYRRDSEAGNPWPSKERAMMIAGMAGGWGAPLNKMAKIAECMFASGRYDACIGVSERALKNMEHGMVKRKRKRSKVTMMLPSSFSFELHPSEPLMTFVQGLADDVFNGEYEDPDNSIATEVWPFFAAKKNVTRHMDVEAPKDSIIVGYVLRNDGYVLRVEGHPEPVQLPAGGIYYLDPHVPHWTEGSGQLIFAAYILHRGTRALPWNLANELRMDCVKTMIKHREYLEEAARYTGVMSAVEG